MLGNCHISLPNFVLAFSLCNACRTQTRQLAYFHLPSVLEKYQERVNNLFTNVNIRIYFSQVIVCDCVRIIQKKKRNIFFLTHNL